LDLLRIGGSRKLAYSQELHTHHLFSMMYSMFTRFTLAELKKTDGQRIAIAR
jgi:hypothetical protein